MPLLRIDRSSFALAQRRETRRRSTGLSSSGCAAPRAVESASSRYGALPHVLAGRRSGTRGLFAWHLSTDFFTLHFKLRPLGRHQAQTPLFQNGRRRPGRFRRSRKIGWTQPRTRGVYAGMPKAGTPGRSHVGRSAVCDTSMTPGRKGIEKLPAVSSKTPAMLTEEPTKRSDPCQSHAEYRTAGVNVLVTEPDRPAIAADRRARLAEVRLTRSDPCQSVANHRATEADDPAMASDALPSEVQSSTGCSAASITVTSTGALADSSFNPSCSRSAVKKDGVFGSAGGESTPAGRGPRCSGAKFRTNRQLPGSPVRSTTTRPAWPMRMLATWDIP
jgi:hypothetical protein